MSRRQLAYTCGALAAGYVVMFLAVLGYVDHVERERRRAEAISQAQQQRQQEQTRHVICDLANGYLKIYVDNPPVTPAQVGVQATWAAMAAQFSCPPPE